MELNDNPFDMFTNWYERAQLIEQYYNAMSLATFHRTPSVRTVFLKQYDVSGFVFYTNLNSRKSQDLAVNPYAELLFFWQKLNRQIRISGNVIQITDKEADEYFASRNRKKQISAWASQQSQVVSEVNALEERYQQYQEKFLHAEKIPRPHFWSGFRVLPEKFEFWQGDKDRLHTRYQYRLQQNKWLIERLYP